jgi:hypothetical protein
MYREAAFIFFRRISIIVSFSPVEVKWKTGMVNVPPAYWNNFDDYNTAKGFVSSLVIVNDPAERGIKLKTGFKDNCKDQQNREYLAQVVEEHRRICPSKFLNKNVIAKA